MCFFNYKVYFANVKFKYAFHLRSSDGIECFVYEVLRQYYVDLDRLYSNCCGYIRIRRLDLPVQIFPMKTKDNN